MPDTEVLAPRATAVEPPRFLRRRFDCASTVRVSVSGELDIATAPQLDHALVILDLRELQFMDSRGANLIAAATGRARQAGDRLLVVRGRDQVERILAFVGLDRQLELVDYPLATSLAAVLDGVQP